MPSSYSKISFYSTEDSFLLVGRGAVSTDYQIVEISRYSKSKIEPNISPQITKEEVLERLKTVKSKTPLKLHGSYCGVIGFIKLDSFYILLAKPDTLVGQIRSHKIYSVKIEIFNFNFLKDYDIEEPLISCLNSFITTEMFYYCNTYDLSLTLQQTETRPDLHNKARSYFIWNRYLKSNSNPIPNFFIDLFYGYSGFSEFQYNNSKFVITLITRRSTRFAGVRYRRRGIDSKGFVGNEVETEIIVSYLDSENNDNTDISRTAAFVIHRGSVPLSWGQPNNKGTHPPIVINGLNKDASDLHFQRLKRDYGSYITVVSLLRTHNTGSTEKELDLAYRALSNYYKINYKEFDFLYYEKEDANTNLLMEKLVESDLKNILYYISFNGEPAKIQNGVFRVNCVDCLDRTNAGQYYIAKAALKSIVPLITGAESTSAVENIGKIVSQLFNEQANFVSLQYGGSEALHQGVYSRTSTNKKNLEENKTGKFANKARNFFSSARRMISNTLFDGDKQRGYNLFLGSYIYGVTKEHFTSMKSTQVLEDWDKEDLVESNFIRKGRFKKIEEDKEEEKHENRSEDVLELFNEDKKGE